MKPVSTGTGLIVLSATIAACFAMSQLESRGKAIAAPGNPTGQKVSISAQMPQGMLTRGAGMPEAPEMPGSEVEQRHSANLPRISPDASCLGEPQQWFDPTLQVFADRCGLIQTYFLMPDTQSFAHADLNGDGEEDFFYLLTGSSSGFTQVVVDGAPVDVGAILASGSYVMTDAGSSLRAFSIFSPGVATGIKVNMLIDADPSLNTWAHRSAWIDPCVGFRDCDGDGSLDLVSYLGIEVWNDDGIQRYSSYTVWFQNTGFQRAPASNPYDLDGDGHVNTADLSLLLMEFTN